MQILDEIPKAPYAEIVKFLLAENAPVPDRVGDSDVAPTTLIAELGLDPPV